MQKRPLLPIEKKLILLDESPYRKRTRIESFSDDEDIPLFNDGDEFVTEDVNFSHDVSLFQVTWDWECQ